MAGELTLLPNVNAFQHQIKVLSLSPKTSKFYIKFLRMHVLFRSSRPFAWVVYTFVPGGVMAGEYMSAVWWSLGVSVSQFRYFISIYFNFEGKKWLEHAKLDVDIKKGSGMVIGYLYWKIFHWHCCRLASQLEGHKQWLQGAYVLSSKAKSLLLYFSRNKRNVFFFLIFSSFEQHGKILRSFLFNIY